MGEDIDIVGSIKMFCSQNSSDSAVEAIGGCR